MKKKLLTKSLSVLLSAVILLTSVPVSAAEGAGDQMALADADILEAKEEEASLAGVEILQDDSDFSVSSNGIGEVTNIFELDWKSAENDEIDHVLGNADWVSIGVWLNSMSEEEIEELLKRDTVLNKETYIQECSVEASSEGEDEINLVPTKSMMLPYYQYALERAETGMPMTRAVFKSSTGYYQIMFVKGSQSCIFQTKLSGLDADIGTSQAQKATISVTNKSGSNFVNFWQYAGSYNTTGGSTVFTLKQHNGSGGYYILNSRIGFTKPAGYTASYEKVLASNTNTANPNNGECKLYYYDDGNWETTNRQYSNSNPAAANEILVTHLNVLNQAGLGTNSDVVNTCYKIVLTPITYKVAYNGNGATGGGVATQTCTYDVAYNYQPNGFVRQYTITYDGNGGQPNVANHTVNYAFQGWNGNGAAVTGMAAGSAFSNAAQTNGATIQLYAIWKAASVTLPGAVRTGYQFTGWSTAQGIKTGGTTYVPGKTETVKAIWRANTYQIQYYDGISSDAKGTQAMTYDVSASLRTLESLGISRPGYTFTGWNSSGGTYGDGVIVSNLTEVNNGKVALTASWSANGDTPYKVRRYVQKKSGNTDLERGYELYSGKAVAGEETFYGLSDSTVTVPAVTIDGYITPDAQMVQIAGDGSTIVNFYYNLAQKEGSTPAGNIYTNNYGLTEAQVQKLLAAINDGSDATLSIDGITYTIVKNADGTLSIKLADMEKAEAITIPGEITIGGKTYPITEIYKECFKNNTTLKEVTVGSNISSIGASAFEGCKYLKKVTLNEGLMNLGNSAFKGCTSLTSIKTPSTLQTIGNYAFMNCTSLKTATLNDGLLKIGNKAFYNCKALVKMKIPKTVLTIGSYAFGKCIKLNSFTFASGSALLTMGTGVFSNCTALVKIKMPAKLTAISGKAFYNCKKLKSVKLGAAVTKIGSSAFENCKVLTSIGIPKRVQTIGSKAFYNCKKLKKVTVQSKALTAVGSKAFKKCKKGLKFQLPGSKKETYTKLLKGKY